MDTGAAHLASAYGIPSVVLFGPAPPEAWGPPASGPHVVLTDASQRRGDVFSEEPDPALLAVGPDDVLAAVDGLGVTPRGPARVVPGGPARVVPGGAARVVPGGAARVVPGGAARVVPGSGTHQ